MYTVIIVVDRSFGERLSSLPVGTPVWIVDTPTNKAEAMRLSKARPNANHLTGITTFTFNPAVSPEADLVNILSAVDLHHGPESADPPYMQIEVIGASCTQEVWNAISGYGFDEFSATSNGFRAFRHSVPLVE